MSKRVGQSPNGVAHVLSICAIALSTSCVSLIALLLGGNNNFNGAVGGIKVDADGVVNVAPVEIQQALSKDIKDAVKPAKGGLEQQTEMRMISLKSLELAIADAIKNNHGVLPDEIKYFGGIQRIEHVFLYPEENDIVLAGPGEGWIVDDRGNVVGETTGHPVVRLEDFIVAMRTVNKAREGYGISCSIDPTEEGRVKFRAFMKNQNSFNPRVLKGAEEALGMQRVTLTGVPEDSHFARVLVAADFKMKRIAMHLEPTPVKEIPSFLTIMKQKRANLTDMMPRWWLACNYEPLSKTKDGLAWTINGPGVKAMTEDEIIKADGSVEGTGKTNPIAQAWSDNMTAHYDELSVAEPVFGDLRNIMDLSVVAALIEKENMLEQVGLKLPVIKSEQSDVVCHSFHVPKTIPTQCSYMKVKKGTLITASGGVQVDSWDVVERSQEDQLVSKKRDKAKPFGTTSWCWN